MKVYVLMEYGDFASEIIDVFDTLEKAQSYRDGKLEDWYSDSNNNRWWEKTLIVTGLGTSVRVQLGIGEWEVK
jgi:hypothetical protein